MPRPKTKTKSEDLARIRNNQRRSRAKRLEYIRDLEEKAKKYDELIESTSTPSLSAVEKLQSENALMRGLLATLDINFNSLGALPINDSEPNMITGSLSSSIETHQYMGNQTPLTFWEQWNSSSLPPDMGLNFDIPLLSNDANISTNLDAPTVGQTEPNPQFNQYQGCCEGAESSATSNSNTTLCSLACQWVIQCNTKGLELDVLYFRMEHGFKQGNNPLEGCRVDNQVLLQVLAEIS